MAGAACAEVPEAGDGEDADGAWTGALRLVVRHVREREATLAGAQDDVAQAYLTLLARLTAAAPSIAPQHVRAVFADQIDDTDRAILRGLDEGPRSTLESRTGISKGVINRRLPRLHLIAGTTTNFQLGRAAHALGWLEPPPDPAGD